MTLLNPSLLSFMKMPDEYAIIEIKAPKNIVGKKLEDIQLRNNYKVNLITIKRKLDSKVDENGEAELHITGVPQLDTIVQEGDQLVIFGHEKDFLRLVEINN